LSPLELFARAETKAAQSVYPPALSGLRGSHPGSFEVSHAIAWGGAKWPRPPTQTDDDYDLIVVGGGISGLAAAFFYRQRHGESSRVLILDNHDDFGGHAKRNEFNVDGAQLIGYGGSQSIDTPGSYSKVAAQLLRDVSIDTERFYQYFDQQFFEKHNLKNGIYFGKEAYGTDSVHADVTRVYGSVGSSDSVAAIEAYPISNASKQSLRRLLSNQSDYLAGTSRARKLTLLRKTSYYDFLLNHAGQTTQVAHLLRDTTRGFWGIGWDALSALEGYRLGMPGTAQLDLGKLDERVDHPDEPYIFHFPDGNAGVARSLVRKLIADAVPGNSMQDLVRSRVDYSLLDQSSENVRIRLNSTVVNVQHTRDEQAVDITYLRGGEAGRVRAKHVVLACYNNIIPHICPEVPDEQREAIAYATKVPLVYINVALRNWRAFEQLGYRDFYIPEGILMHSFGLDFPVSMGGYEFARKPDQATVVHGSFVPTVPNQGLNAREQHKAGRKRLYEMSFADFERDIVRQMSGALQDGNFDAERDIAGITVNRWPHGYAYEYNDYADPADWNPYNGPHLTGAAQIGRISIANSDASAFAYVNGAIDAADRAVNEQIAYG